MQRQDEHSEETTYAGHQFARQSVPAANQHIILGQQPTDRNAQIYSYVTLVAERCHDARMTRVKEVNEPKSA